MKKKPLPTFKNAIELNEYFKDDAVCRRYLKKIIWDDNPVCPHCGNEEYYEFSDGRRYKCKTCKKQFTVTVGTFLESSNIPLRKWLHAIFIFTSHKKGISSHQLAKDIGITQKSAWFMLSRIREILKEKAPQMLEGVVEADETYIGGKISNWSNKKRAAAKNKFSRNAKTAVVGLVQRDGKIVNVVVNTVDRAIIGNMVASTVKSDSTIVTDSASFYSLLKQSYPHEIVNHAGGEYFRNGFHTNTIEGYWSHLKRTIYGTYHHTSKQHLHRYCNESAFRYNTRKLNEVERFDTAIRQAFGRLKYADLIGKRKK